MTDLKNLCKDTEEALNRVTVKELFEDEDLRVALSRLRNGLDDFLAIINTKKRPMILD